MRGVKQYDEPLPQPDRWTAISNKCSLCLSNLGCHCPEWPSSGLVALALGCPLVFSETTSLCLLTIAIVPTELEKN